MSLEWDPGVTVIGGAQRKSALSRSSAERASLGWAKSGPSNGSGGTESRTRVRVGHGHQWKLPVPVERGFKTRTGSAAGEYCVGDGCHISHLRHVMNLLPPPSPPEPTPMPTTLAHTRTDARTHIHTQAQGEKNQGEVRNLATRNAMVREGGEGGTQTQSIHGMHNEGWNHSPRRLISFSTEAPFIRHRGSYPSPRRLLSFATEGRIIHSTWPHTTPQSGGWGGEN